MKYNGVVYKDQEYNLWSFYNKKINYAAMPKCGCSSVKKMLLKIEDICPEVIEDSFQDIHIASRSYLNRKWNRKHPGDNKILFTVVRDPVKRFKSAYKNGCDNGSINKDIDQFLTDLENTNITNAWVKHHFKPQTNFISSNKEIFDKIFKTNEMHLVKEYLEDISNKKLFENDEIIENYRNSESIKITPEQEKRICEFYHKDYENGWC